MTLLKKSFKEFKQRMYRLAIPQFLLFFAALFFFVFSKAQLGARMQKIQEFQPQLQQMLSTINATDPSSIAQATSIIETMNQATNQALFFALVIIPLFLLIFWVIFQGLFWSTIKKGKIKNLKTFFLKFTIPTALLLFAVVHTFTKSMVPGDFFSAIDSIVIKSIIFIFIALYFLTIYYAVLSNQKFNKILNTTFSLAFKKAHKFIPLYIPLFINTLIILTLFIITLTQQSISSYAFLEVIPLIILIILTLAFSIFYKIFFQRYVEKECGSKGSNLSRH